MSVSPGDDETIISFLSRVSVYSGKSWTAFQQDVTGKTFRKARVAERRNFDWDNLSARLGVPRVHLESLSERTYFVAGLTDAKVESLVQTELPWLSDDGYAAYNPTQLQKGQYFRKRWFSPHSLFDAASGTLNLRRCYLCGTRLADVQVGQPFPTCAHCAAPLSAAPKIAAPACVKTIAEDLADEIEPISRSNLLGVDCRAVRVVGAVWRIATALNRSPLLQRVAAELVAEAHLGELTPVPSPSGSPDSVAHAIRHAQLLGAALEIARHFEDIVDTIYHECKRKQNAIDAFVVDELVSRFVAGAEPTVA